MFALQRCLPHVEFSYRQTRKTRPGPANNCCPPYRGVRVERVDCTPASFMLQRVGSRVLLNRVQVQYSPFHKGSVHKTNTMIPQYSSSLLWHWNLSVERDFFCKLSIDLYLPCYRGKPITPADFLHSPPPPPPPLTNLFRLVLARDMLLLCRAVHMNRGKSIIPGDFLHSPPPPHIYLDSYSS